MSRTPNAEQLLAIEHQGGIILKAGAGSGKTFVLVEHILYLSQNWIHEFKKNPQGNFEDFLRSKFSQVVMMTFTKKAAGEMSIRLNEKFLEKSSIEDPDQSYWKTANDVLPMLMVTTIDGFCRKLITMGYFPHLSTEAKIIFDAERTDQVRELVEEWLETEGSTLDQITLETVVREKKHLLNAFTNIFSDPGLRLSWKKFDLKEIHPDTNDILLKSSFELNGLENSLKAIHDLEMPEEKERSAFEKVVASFQNCGLPVVDSVEKLAIYSNLFAPIKVLRGESTASKKSPASTAAKDGLAELRTWVNQWAPVIQDYQEHFESKVKPWMHLCQSLFNFIEEKLDPNLGMTFGDIEYLVSLGLENEADRDRIQKTFEYFIVDEFQDTSDIQFKIISNLINSDFKRLFCVGDAKQAIYGFRGGELSVFQDCEKLMPTTRTLANNYRSLPEIIDFNNSLFRTLLPLGQNYEGVDPFTVAAEDQNIPSEVEHTQNGVVEILQVELQEKTEENDDDSEEEAGINKFSTSEINRLEAIAIARSIQKERLETTNVCTVLYSKLRPSIELIRTLMEMKVGFTAQYKIDLLDEPVIGIFVCLLKRFFDPSSETRDKFPLFLFKNYFEVLGLHQEVTASDLEDFDQDVKFWGIVEAFRKFIYKLNMTNENSDINFKTIETIAELYQQDPELMMNQLKSSDNQRLSLDLRSGEEAHMVQIMSAHASKGLEFDKVYLGGIYTNGRDQSGGALFGDLPGSFNWYLDVATREKQKSPLLIFENELAKYKDFSENKRLFYVACTRAKKKLCWVDFSFPEKTFSIPKNSWIIGLGAWMASGMKNENVFINKLEDFNSAEILNGKSAPELPLFFHDAVGIFPKGEGKTELMIAAELSVTRLNSLVDCPRKFYLGNILKVTEPSNTVSHFVEEEGEELAQVMRSSSERGTHVHAQIAEGINRNFVVPRESFGTDLQGPIEWALNLLKEYQSDYDLISETQIKFKFFNFMISGIPDLVLMPKGDKKAQIWDFKTGRMTPENLSHYWLQLSTYAYALFQLGLIPRDSEVELVLCFVDQKKNINQSIDWKKCQADLYPIWRAQNEPWKVNLDHCSQCSYGSICPR